MLDWFNRDKGTFRAIKKPKAGERNYKLASLSRATLGSGNVQQGVKCPTGENLNDWLATNVVEFFNQLSCLYGPIAEFCTPERCPTTTAGPHYSFYWRDNDRYKKETMLPARDYITHVFVWAEQLINDETIFPPDVDIPFPADFDKIVKKIFSRLFRIYAHVFHHHQQDIIKMGFEAHWNTSFKHFITFVHEFDLIPQKELAPLQKLIDQVIPAQ